ncbi:uncharacterized protein LOC115890646 [Sitophilus oryzae]|uniref:Uncharacterized protein LOC115890646 n=1 Tax=Sitophilus oryzae TaxID=7048 RepID=A0A6J2YVC9_SITOR|nr:uncharacterized protein LOC115890646 [Sitophilus oryzae]
MNIWWSLLGYFIGFICIQEVTSKVHPLTISDSRHQRGLVKSRIKRQFRFSGNSEEQVNIQDRIYFNDDSNFNSFEERQFPRQNNNFQNPFGGFRGQSQNGNFQNNLNNFGFQSQNDNFQNNFNNFGFQSSTSRPQGFTTVPIPGMGTTMSACESRCLTTSQYNPVCGDNNITYSNIERYKCAVKCGKNVKIAANRACSPFGK